MGIYFLLRYPCLGLAVDTRAVIQKDLLPSFWSIKAAASRFTSTTVNNLVYSTVAFVDMENRTFYGDNIMGMQKANVQTRIRSRFPPAAISYGWM